MGPSPAEAKAEWDQAQVMKKTHFLEGTISQQQRGKEGDGHQKFPGVYGAHVFREEKIHGKGVRALNSIARKELKVAVAGPNRGCGCRGQKSWGGD